MFMNDSNFMKRTFVLLTAAVLLAACSKNEPDPIRYPEGTGALALNVGCTPEVAAVTRAGEVPLPDGITVPDGMDLRMRIVSTTTGTPFDRVWARVREYNPRQDLMPEADYRITVFSTSQWVGAENVDNIPEGENKPYFEGVTNTRVVARQQTPVTIAAKLANTIVRIDFTERFRNYFPNGARFTLTTAAGNKFEVGYSAEDHTVAETYWYVRPKRFTIAGLAVKQLPSSTADAEVVRFAEVVNETPAARTLYTYKFDVSGVGDTSEVIITLNENPVATETVDTELNDDAIL